MLDVHALPEEAAAARAIARKYHLSALRKLTLQALTRELTAALRRSLSNSSKLATRLRTIMQGFARDSE